MNSENNTTVRFELVGGLGNQLFQWAAANYYAQKTKNRTILDLTYCSNRFSAHKSSITELEFNTAFSLPIEVSTNPIAVYGGEWLASRSRYINKTRNLIQDRYVVRTTGFIENLEYKNPKSFRGYFQTYKYLENLSKNPMEAGLNSKKTFYSTRDPDEVAIHIRRGDYLALKDSFGVLSNQYYLMAIDKLKEIVNPSKIAIFSSDRQAAESLAKEIGSLAYVFSFVQDRLPQLNQSCSTYIQEHLLHNPSCTRQVYFLVSDLIYFGCGNKCS